MFEKFIIFKENWKEIRDEVISVGFDKFQKHPQCDYDNYRALNTGENPGIVLSVGGDDIKENIKLYPKTWELYNELDLPSKQSIGFAYLTPTSVINIHTDPEDCYRYHLCLQVEENTSNIFGNLMRDTESESFINEGEAVILEPAVIEHWGKNDSDYLNRLHLVIDFLEGPEDKSILEYQKLFNKDGWNV
tara:strand:+ start:115 stop:684 length:570 start_codon:yes stop_codon:yes gene_type:complete